MIIRYSFNTNDSVPQRVNSSILKTRTRILEVMIAWLNDYLPDYRQNLDIIDTSIQFLNEITSSDDPPETLPISETMELKETLEKLDFEGICLAKLICTRWRDIIDGFKLVKI